jgi:hypothetical protein
MAEITKKLYKIENMGLSNCSHPVSNRVAGQLWSEEEPGK